MVVSVDSLEIATWAGVVILALLLAVGFITLAESIVRRVQDYRRERVTSSVRFGMLERMTSEEPAWTAWVETLSAAERDVARDLLEEYLRTTRGTERTRLQELGRVMELHTEADRTLSRGKHHKQLQALTWLALLEEPIEPDRLRSICTADSGLRAAGARLLYETDHADARPIGTELLVGDGDVTLSVYGLDTLYLLHRDDPTALLERAKAAHTEWRPSLLIQVLTVLSHCGIASRDAAFEWIVALTEHELPSVRAAAILALTPEGWRSSLRAAIDTDALIGDPDPEMRRAVYAMLAEWGDRSALDTLAEAARTETDQRSRVKALERVQHRPELVDPDMIGLDDPEYERAWRWVQANEEVVDSA